MTGAIREQRGHQGTINLEKTDRKRSQVGKRCAASPEIVDGSRDMKALQLGQDIRRMRWIVHRDPIRDFELKCGCFNLCFVKDPANLVQQMRAGEMLCGNINCYFQRSDGGIFALPAAGLPASLQHHPLIDGRDESGVLGNLEETVGTDKAVNRVLPAHERFKAGNLTILQGNNRLVIHAQLSTTQRGAKLIFQLEAMHSACVHGRIKKFGAIATQGLGLAQSGLRVIEQIIGVQGLDRSARYRR